MDFSKSFSYVFKDSKWLSKIFIGGLWNIVFLFFLFLTFVFGGFLSSTGLLFLGIPFILSYFLSVVENCIKDEEFPLPFWTDLSRYFKKGVILELIYLAYTFPVIVIYSFLEDSFGDSDALVLLLFMVVLFWLPIVTINYAKTGDIMSAFKFEEMLNSVSSNIGIYVPMVLLSLAVIGISFSIGLFVAGIGIPFTSFWGMLVVAHLFGQFGKHISGSKEESIQINV